MPQKFGRNFFFFWSIEKSEQGLFFKTFHSRFTCHLHGCIWFHVDQPYPRLAPFFPIVLPTWCAQMMSGTSAACDAYVLCCSTRVCVIVVHTRPSSFSLNTNEFHDLIFGYFIHHLSFILAAEHDRIWRYITMFSTRSRDTLQYLLHCNFISGPNGCGPKLVSFILNI